MAWMLGQRFGTRRSRQWMRQLEMTEVPEVHGPESDFPIVLRSASGARVRDVDGNRYIDLTGFFGAALVGHRNPAVVSAIRAQAGRLLHGMGDVHPPEAKARLLRRLVGRMPWPGFRAILSLNGSDAVESALKFAAAASRRPGVVAFEGAYHGLGLGALEVTHAARFRNPFAAAMTDRALFLPFPTLETAAEVLSRARLLASGKTIGAVIVEPIQGRGGIRPFPDGFLAALADLAREAGWFLIADEVYTGMGRTGRFLASEDSGFIPDAVCLGKALGGGVPISACLMGPGLADAVSQASGEAVHTSTFLGTPLGCAAACAVLSEIDRKGLLARAARIGDRIRARAASWFGRFPLVGDVRGAGAMIGVDLRRPGGGPATDEARAITARCLRDGVILLTEGPESNVLALTPPLVIEDRDLAFALDTIEAALEKTCRTRS